MIISRVLPIMSATGPRTGWTSAKGTAKAVDSRATLFGSVASPLAISGTIGSMARVASAVAKPTTLTWMSTCLMTCSLVMGRGSCRPARSA
jgi:hypothetical protein